MNTVSPHLIGDYSLEGQGLPQAMDSENCSLPGTDNANRQICKIIFLLNEGLNVHTQRF